MPECIVTGTLRNAQGTVLPSTKIVFERNGVVGQAGSVIIPRWIEVTSDEAGLISVGLYPGSYRAVTIGVRQSEVFGVGVPDAETADLADLIAQSPPITPTILAQVQALRDQTLTDAEAASEDAAAVSAALATASAILGSGNGRFPNGTAALPSVAFAGDTDTGFFRDAANRIGAVTGGITRWLLSSAGFEINVPITGTAVTQSATDSTAGRLLKTGDFGLGLRSGASMEQWPHLVENGGLDNVTGVANGFYSTTAATGSPNGAFSPMLYLKRNANFNEIQAVFTPQGIFYRTAGPFNSGFPAWSAWGIIYDQSNILGTVSQSGGVPTGAIIERGSNANGEFVRYADGTQECWRRDASVDAADTLLTFPANFASNQIAFVGIGPSGNMRSVTRGNMTDSTVTARLWDQTGAKVSGQIDYIAKGRWF